MIFQESEKSNTAEKSSLHNFISVVSVGILDAERKYEDLVS